MSVETVDKSDEIGLDGASGSNPVPGLVLVFAAGEPMMIPVPFRDGIIELGRDYEPFATIPDARLSRKHATCRLDAGRFYVRDLGSRNGSSVDGDALPAHHSREMTRIVRVGDSLLVSSRKIEFVRRYGVRRLNGRVEGAALQHALQAVVQAARHGAILHITGESGSGKEGLARAFHAEGRASAGPFVAVNCATIPETVAERLLFGAKRGAYSGVDADAEGFVQAAHGGTLFLDEVAELSLAVQAKLLRVLETGEVFALGATKPRKVDLRLCSATHRDLRAMVAAGKLREDLYYRVSTPRIAVPPLRDRPEEIPYLVAGEINKIRPDLGVHISFVETCLLRAWPGNVRELLTETRHAVQTALSNGSKRVEAQHLNAHAGAAFESSPADKPRAATFPDEPIREPPPSPADISSALKRGNGNISAAARDLGVHRTQLKRWMERYGIQAREIDSDDRDGPKR